MSKIEFLAQLESLLLDIPEQEREAALDYYESYFEEAGKDQESQVIQELGSPGKVAAIIKADLEENSGEYGEYTEQGYQDERFGEKACPEKKEEAGQGGEEEREENQDQDARRENNWDGRRYREFQGAGRGGYDGPYRRAGYGNRERHKRSGSAWLLIVILAILALPVLGGVGLGGLGVLAGIVFGVLGLFLGLGAGAAALIIGGLALFVHTLLFQLASPATALAAAGAGLLMTAFGLLCLLAFLWLALKAIPAVFRGVVDLIQRIFYRGNQGGRRA